MDQRAMAALRCVLVVAIGFALFGSSGCKREAPEETTVPSEQADQVPSETVAAATLPDANTAFAFNLYGALRAEDGNLFLSPYSVSAALAMTLAGARGETAQQMTDVLCVGGLEEDLGAAFGGLDQILHSRADLGDPEAGEGFDLHVVNALWPQAGYELLDAFVETLTTQYRAELRELDYEADPEAARLTINDWVSEQTAERIENLIPEGIIDAMTRLVLTNAIYFNAPWLEPFHPDSTVTEPFTRLDGELIDVAMMHKTGTLLYAELDVGIAVEIPYNGNQLAMLVLLPDEGAFNAFDASLDVDVYAGIVESLVSERIALGLPRFEYEYATSLVPALEGLGMTDAFDGERSNFSGITGDTDLVVSDVLHKAFVSVDEEGTEAAAATAVVMRATAMPTQPLEITVNRPFLFVLRDRPTGSVLFIGRVLEP
jgi:serpin B